MAQSVIIFVTPFGSFRQELSLRDSFNMGDSFGVRKECRRGDLNPYSR